MIVTTEKYAVAIIHSHTYSYFKSCSAGLLLNKNDSFTGFYFHTMKISKLHFFLYCIQHRLVMNRNIYIFDVEYNLWLDFFIFLRVICTHENICPTRGRITSMYTRRRRLVKNSKIKIFIIVTCNAYCFLGIRLLLWRHNVWRNCIISATS